MKSIVRNVRDIDAGDRQALEHVVGEPLGENQQLVISVLSLIDPQDIETAERLRLKSPSSAELRQWADGCAVPELADVPDHWE
ncbi:MAG TPA: hypothetical protein VML55_16940 [Planctomycetaceae bacterium]|nr:hypothetical protein [Planctomycetaceae bacterium]